MDHGRTQIRFGGGWHYGHKNGSLWTEIIRGSVQSQVGESPARHWAQPIQNIVGCMDETRNQIRRNGILQICSGLC